jgi:cell cycle related kinase
MINNSPIFPGENDIDQLACVFRVLGTPTAATWPDVDSLPDYNKITFEEMPAVPLEDVVANTTASAIDLLQKMIVLNATKRMTAHAALIHE